MKHLFRLNLAMKFIQLVCSCLTLLFASSATAATPALSIIQKGSSDYQIILPEQHDSVSVALYLRQAAQCLQEEIQTATGCLLPICSEGQRDPRKPAIFIGNTKITASQGFPVGSLDGFSCIIAVRDRDVFIVGKDYQAYHDKTHRRDYAYNLILGSVKGTVVFMEDYLGTRFLYPGKTGILTPRCENLQLPGNLTRLVKVPIDHSCGRPTTLMYDYAISNYGFGRYFVYGGHSYYSAVPAETYAKTHPEYFTLLGGKRVTRGNHLCISNPHVQDLLFQEMLRRLDQGVEVVELGQTDGYIPCQCDACKAYGNTDDPGEKLWIMHRTLAQRLKRERPGKMVLINAYSHTAQPPKSFRTFPDNVMIENCHHTPETARAWKDYEGIRGVIAYIYNWGSYHRTGLTPYASPNALATQARMFLNTGVRGIYRCGFAELFGLEGPGYYAYGKILENPRLNVSSVLDDFYKHAFQEAATPMTAFYSTLYQRLDSYCAMSSMAASSHDWVKEPENPRIILSFIYSPDILEKLGNLLSRAERLATTPHVKQRLKLVRTEYDYARHIGTIIHLYNAYRIKPSQETFSPLADAIEARNAFLDSLCLPNQTLRKLPGWPELPPFGYFARKNNLMVNGRGSAILNAPFNWNTKMLREKNILPGSKKKQMTISKATGKIMTMDFTSGAWQIADWQHLKGIQLGEIKERTRFKIIYDVHNLYVAIETQLPDTKTFVPQGKDGPTWGTDCLEILVDPYGNRERYYHLIYNPIQESYYDERFGFITDVLHPLYNACDPSWDGTWSYVNKRKNNTWLSICTIPFRTLGVKTPMPGESWALNVAREAFHKPHTDPELSLWSPNMETMSFQDIEAFGDAVFK